MKRYLALVVLVGGFALTACETMQMPWQRGGEPVAEMDTVDAGVEAPSVPEPGLSLAPEQRFSDLPLPVGVKENPARSFIYESSTLQIGRMVYESKASVNDLTQFFIRECPTASWQLKDLTQAEGAQMLFTKPGRRLTITISELGVGRGGRELILLMTPESN